MSEPYVTVDGEAEPVPIRGRLVVGRDCFGIAPEQRFVVDDDEVSRHHLEIRLGPDGRRASLIDTSANGTRLNGARVERGAPIELIDGDRIRVGATELEFRSPCAPMPIVADADPRSTARPVKLARMAIAVGDIISYTAISESVDAQLVSAEVGRLFSELRTLLSRYRGTVGNYVGDALLALWEHDEFDDAVDRALGFAFDAIELVDSIAARFEIRHPDGGPIRMGWGIVDGVVSTASIGGFAHSVHGDPANLAFRLAGLAGRDQPGTLATAKVLDGATISTGQE